ncbi:class I adenylate-forming enzyme family protein [Amycolatopsis sp. WQ 127309]|uniref:AMP-binding protein n=1 Tax=Amycolatopsis sp. WQ 127309 TaxID=2932773 RepID=UPI001FF23FD7|nr:class I adenylate-forming enzyme family protein [Amycolatopsis sp. WQ 127309]UOZ07004.1 AMP-binding protein [Amycolatopsis sp. WQ 127309]
MLAFMERAAESWTADWCGGAPATFAPPDGDVEFRTSGSTGQPRTWWRTYSQMWAEAGLIADLLTPARPVEIVSFAPPSHLYGALSTGLLGARLGVRTRYVAPGRPIDALPVGANLLVVAIPSTFTLLRAHTEQLAAAPRLTFLHSTAMLPTAAEELLGALDPTRARLIEIFGSTETGGIATRTRGDEAGRWTLMPDVSFADAAVAEDHTDEDPRLTVRSPRLARPAGGVFPIRWTTDDHVRRLGERQFAFAGRRDRLVKVNGRRIDLDHLTATLVARVSCADLACVPVRDAVRGEGFDIHVAEPGSEVHQQIAAVVQEFGVLPRAIRRVSKIARSATGKTLGGMRG